MGNYIKTSDIVDPNIQQPYTGNDLDFWQAFNNENIQGIVYGIIGESLYGLSASQGVVVSGCTKSGSGDTIFNGWIFYKNILYFFPGATGLNSYVNPPQLIYTEVADVTIDPVEFTDAVFRNVHFIKRFASVDQVAAGLFLMSNMGRVVGDIRLVGSDTATTTGALTPVAGTSFTSPNRICDLEIIIECTGEFAGTASVATEGGSFIIYNVTTSTALASRSLQGASVPNLMSIYTPVRVGYTYRSVPANTNIQFYIQRTATNDVAAFSPTITYREILRPKMW